MFKLGFVILLVSYLAITATHADKKDNKDNNYGVVIGIGKANLKFLFQADCIVNS